MTTEKLYRVLFEIPALREEYRALSHAMPADDALLFLLRLGDVEASAVRLVDDSESRRRVSSH